MSEQPREVPPPLEDGYEEALVTLENVGWVAERSGKDEQELRAMLMVKDMMKKELRVRYRVVELTDEYYNHNGETKRRRRWLGKKRKK